LTPTINNGIIIEKSGVRFIRRSQWLRLQEDTILQKRSCTEQAIESFFRGLEILRELEEMTGYHYPFSDTIQEYISQLQKQK
jgi:hypothetical protein